MESPPTSARYLNAFWNGSTITTVRRDDAGKRVLSRLPAEIALFLRAKDVDDDLKRSLRNSRQCLGVKLEGEWVRTRWQMREHAHAFAKWCKLFGKIPTFEGDMSPVDRWMVDSLIEVARPRRVFVDIETDSRVPFAKQEQARILCWSLVDERGRFLTQLLEEDCNDAERVLLEGLWKALRKFDQIVGWNVDRFDMPVICARTEKHRLRVEPREWLWLDHLVLFQRMNMSAAESGDEKQSMALEAVAQSVLGEGKLDGMSGAKSWERWESGGEERERLARYCKRDSDLMRLIEEKTGYLELFQTLCESTFVFPDTDSIRPTHQVDSFLLRLGKSRGMHFPSHFEPEITEGQFAGAYVSEPSTRGIAKDVHVCDFAAMYPSMILSWNMSPDTYRPGIRLQESDEGRPSYLSHLPLRRFPCPEGHAFVPGMDTVFVQQPRGILCEAIEEMVRLRKYWNDLKASLPPGTPEWEEANRRSAAYKISGNSFFGVVSSPFSRHFMREVGESITQAGVWLIKQSIEAAESGKWIRDLDGPDVPVCKMKCVYTDTDSIFVVGVSEETFGRFCGWCNTVLYPRLLKEQGCERNTVKIAYEKAFARLVMVGKKRYAGKYSHFKGTRATADSKLEIKGLEFKRGDTARLARDLQAEVVDMVIRQEIESIDAISQVLDRWREKVLKGELPLDQVVLSKRLSKHVREYVVRKSTKGNLIAQPSHVQVAHELAKRGQDVSKGTKIEYVVIDGDVSPAKVIPAEDFKGDCDRYYLWESLVYPPTQRFLDKAFPVDAVVWERWENVRPRKAKASDAQLGLLGVDTSKPARKRTAVKKLPPAGQGTLLD